MRQLLQNYLNQFSKIYPKRPAVETWDVYERVLCGVSDLDLQAACEICLGELKYFPMPAEIRERVKKEDKFVSTVNKFPADNPPDEATKRQFEKEMNRVAARLGIRKISEDKTL